MRKIASLQWWNFKRNVTAAPKLWVILQEAKRSTLLLFWTFLHLAAILLESIEPWVIGEKREVKTFKTKKMSDKRVIYMQEYEKKVWKERHSELSLISFLFTFQCFRETQYKQIRNWFISSFPKMTKMGSTEIITQFEKKNRDGLVCFKESIQICCHSEWASIYGYCGMRSLYARKQPSATLFWNCYTSISLPRPLP